jgi:hypothetical protein
VKSKIFRSVILPVVLYRCETWLLTVRERHRLILFENNVEQNIWIKMEEFIEGWRKL